MFLKLEEKIDFEVYDMIANHISDICFFDMGGIINLNPTNFTLIKNTLTTFMYRAFINLPQDDNILRKKVMYSFCYLLLNPKENYFSITFNETSKAAIEGWIEEKTNNEEWRQTFGIWDGEKLREWGGKTWADWNTQALKEWKNGKNNKEGLSSKNDSVLKNKKSELLENYKFWNKVNLKEKNQNIFKNIDEDSFFEMVENHDFSRICKKPISQRVKYNIVVLARVLGEEWGEKAAKTLGGTLRTCGKMTSFNERKELDCIYRQ